jgi:hypothetical protein
MIVVSGIFIFSMFYRDQVENKKEVKNLEQNLPTGTHIPNKLKSNPLHNVNKTNRQTNIVKKRDVFKEPKKDSVNLISTNAPTIPPRKQLFHTHTDQLLAMIASIEPGVPGPPLPIPDNFDEMFLEQCKQPIVIEDDDSDEIKEIKKKVWEARQEIAKIMKEENLTFKQVIDEHQETVSYNYKIWKDASAELEQIFKSGDIEGAKKYHKAMNEAFRQAGILELDMPK